MNTIPIAHAVTSARPQARYGTSPRHRILVVDDDISIRQLNTEVLVRHGYHVDTAEDGAVAWETLQLNSYDLLVADNRMPKVSGVELLQKLRAARMALPVIMATGIVPTEEFARYPGIRPEATLLKPYTLDEMLRTVKEVLHASASLTEQTVTTQDQPNLPSVDRWQL